MTSTNLTRAEAESRARMLTVNHYDVDLDLRRAAEGDAEFGSTTTVRFTVDEPGDTFIDLRAARVDEVLLDAAEITAEAVSFRDGAYDEEKGLALTGLSAGEHTLKVTARCLYSRTGEGLHRFTDPADGQTYLYTQFETADAKRMMACFDQPDLKATWDFTISTPLGWTVIANAKQVTEAREDTGVAVHRSKVDYPLSSYLIAVCAGPYVAVTDEWRGHLTHHPETPEGQPGEDTELVVPLGIYARASIAAHVDADKLFRETKQGFDYYHRNFGYAYPYGKYDQVFVPEFNAGAMENAGCVTIRDEYVFTSKATHYRYERRADTILHELAHMWFGDLVTMRWWNDLWLNESFATWSSAMSQSEETEYDTAWVTFAAVEKAWAYQQDQLPTTHPISTDASDIETVDQNFDGITYAKGASVLKQLQAYVGRENFFAGVRRHFAAHQWDNATFEDLLDSLEKASGRDLSDWAGQWLKTTGISRLAPEFETDDGTYSAFAVVQSGETLRTHRIAVGLYDLGADGKVTRRSRVEVDVTGERTEVAELVGEKAADLVLVNDDDLTYCLMGLDEASRAFVVEHIGDIESPMARTLCWSAAWEETRAGEMPAREFARLVTSAVGAETQLSVVERVLAQATTAVHRYADPAWAEAEGRDLLCDALIAGARGEDPDAALIFAQELTRAPLSDAAVAYLLKLVAAEPGATVGALTVDADLRWLALTALIAHSRYEDAESAEAAISELAAADRSASGTMSAVRARAAIPTAEAKRTAWDAAVSGELSNLGIRHTTEGLTWADPGELLQQFNEEYFRIAPRIWNEFSPEMAQRTLLELYPRWDVTEEHLGRADALLAETSGGLHRLLAENRDRMVRTLRLRKVDAEAAGE